MTHNTHFPSLHGGGDSYALQLAELIINDARQQRDVLAINAHLMAAAQGKVELLVPLNELRHTIAGTSANQNVIDYGFPLPDWYPLDGNNVESLSVGQQTPADALEAFWGSPGHRAHVFGETSFYRSHMWLGVGYTPVASPQGWAHWIAVITGPDETG